MNKFAFVIHTHTDCKDLWPMFFGQLNKYFPNYNKYVLVNEPSTIEGCTKCFIYDENIAYVKRFDTCLNSIDEEILLFTHEDMILYDNPNNKIINELCDLIEEGLVDFIKLLKCKNPRETFLQSKIHDNLIQCPKEFSFSVQPTLSRRSSLFNLFNKASQVGELSIWDFERIIPHLFSEDQSKKCFMSSTKNENQRGEYHWDSEIYPHGNMIFKGEWVYSEYQKELDFLSTEYSIPLATRGFHG